MNLVHAIRPSDENVALLLHVLGAMLLVGGLLTAASSLALARESVNLLRLGYVALLAVALPGWIAMFAGRNGSTARKVSRTSPSARVGLTGFLAAEFGGVLLLAALILGGVGVRRLRTGKGQGCSRRRWRSASCSSSRISWRSGRWPASLTDGTDLVSQARRSPPHGPGRRAARTSAERPRAPPGARDRPSSDTKARRSPCGVPCSAHHGTFAG